MPTSTRNRTTSQPPPAQSTRSKSHQETPQATRKSGRVQSKGPTQSSPLSTPENLPSGRKTPSNNPKGRPKKISNLQTVPEEEEEPKRIKPRKTQKARSMTSVVNSRKPQNDWRVTSSAQVPGAKKAFEESRRRRSGHRPNVDQTDAHDQTESSKNMDNHQQRTRVSSFRYDGPPATEEEEANLSDQESDDQNALPGLQHGEAEDQGRDHDAELAQCNEIKKKGKTVGVSQESDPNYEPTGDEQAEEDVGSVQPPYATSHTAPSQELERRRELAWAGTLTDRKMYIDAQPNASRIEFDEASQQNAQSGSLAEQRPQASDANIFSEANSGRLSQVQEVDNLHQPDDQETSATQDEGFSTHQTNDDAKEQRRSTAKSIQANAKRRAPDDFGTSANKRQPTVEEHTARNLAPPSQYETSQPQILPDESSHRYSEAHQVALGIGRVKPYVPQVRKAWTFDETTAFIDGIARLGPKYSAIAKWDETQNGYVLKDRTQVNMKDKARNMKLDYLK